MSQIFGSGIAWLIDIIIGTYILIVVLRFLLQKLHADFHNPVSQFVLKATSPLLNPMRKVIPGYAGLDISSLVLAYGLSVIKIFLIFFFSGFGFHLFISMGQAIPDLVDSFLSVFLYAIFIQAIFSWIPNMQYNPASSVLDTLTRPILNFVRRYIPTQTNGFDFSSLIAIIGITFIKLTLIPSLNLIFGITPR